MSDEAEKPGFERVMLLVAAVLLGGFLGMMRVPPFNFLADGASATGQLIAEVMAERPLILSKNEYEGEGLVTNVADKVQPGLTLVQGVFPEGVGIRLVDEAGKVLHYWKADFFDVWPDADEVFPDNVRPKSDYQYFIQGFAPLPDGSVLLNFSYQGLVRLDKCSNLMWRSDRRMHHSVTPTADGNFWVSGLIENDDTPPEFFPYNKTGKDIDAANGDSLSQGYNNSVILVNSDGKILKEFSVLEAMYKGDFEHGLYAALTESMGDPIHLNDIEVVTAALAAKIDGVNEGDLLLSVHGMSMLAIMDQDTGLIKWHQQGPWARQHDPDITDDGMIELFNNRIHTIANNIDTSQIQTFDAATRKTQVLFPVAEADKFYSVMMGTHQALANGNRLITESTQGRVFEVTPQGEIVWDYRQPYDDEYASLFAAAERVPQSFFTNGVPKCPK